MQFVSENVTIIPLSCKNFLRSCAILAEINRPSIYILVPAGYLSATCSNHFF